MSKILFPKIFPVACHTDQIGKGSTFVAVRGMKEDGISYIVSALQKGAHKIVVKDSPLPDKVLRAIEQYHAELVYVKNARKALAQLSAQALGFPAKKLRIIGVTGTKGKTTTCFLLEHLLQTAGYKTAMLSTVHNKINKIIFSTNLTTQHPDYLHIFFNECVNTGVEWVVMEVAAQALSLERVHGIEFDGVVFTNFDLEHSEFYDSIEDYFAAKCTIFNYAKKDAPLLVNADDAWCQNILKSKKELIPFSLKDSRTTYSACLKTSNADRNCISLDNQEYCCSSLLGEFNAYNILAAIALLDQLGISKEAILKGLKSFSGVPGRLEIHKLANGVKVIIDKAHNPSSYKAVLGTLRSMAEHLIVVFGCGGERDTIKRPLMGKIASELADLVILTNDDPRSEDPETILQNILVGIDQLYSKKVYCELDRKKAIEFAYKHATKDSIIVLLGKGPDEYQLINGVKHFFSEREILQSLR